MSMLRNLEGKIENLVEGVFGRAFKSQVQPVELARKLVKEMDDHQTVSVSRTYVPNEYSIYLSPRDREQFAEYEEALQSELSGYLLEHAREEGLALLTRPAIKFEIDERLRVGEFGIQTRLVRPPESDHDEPSQGAVGQTMVYAPVKRGKETSVERKRDPQVLRALLITDGGRLAIDGDSVVIGRSRGADVVLDDPNVSRRHAELAFDRADWYVRDLGSTNGVVLNGRQVESARLKPGDEIVIGTSRLVFDLE